MARGVYVQIYWTIAIFSLYSEISNQENTTTSNKNSTAIPFR